MRMIDDKGHGVSGGGGGIGPPSGERVPCLVEAILCLEYTRLHQIKSNFHVNQGG